MIVSNDRYAIVKLLPGAVLRTEDIRRYLGRDPHPTLGRLEADGVIQRCPDLRDHWELTDLGVAYAEVGRLER